MKLRPEDGGVSAVEQGMDAHRRDIEAGGQLDQRDQVPVHARGRRPAQPGRTGTKPAGLSCTRTCLNQRGPVEEGPVRDGGVDPRQVLEHRPSGAQVEVADLRVSHLAGGQADGVLGRAQDRSEASVR